MYWQRYISFSPDVLRELLKFMMPFSDLPLLLMGGFNHVLDPALERFYAQEQPLVVGNMRLALYLRDVGWHDL